MGIVQNRKQKQPSCFCQQGASKYPRLIILTTDLHLILVKISICHPFSVEVHEDVRSEDSLTQRSLEDSTKEEDFQSDHGTKESDVDHQEDHKETVHAPANDLTKDHKTNQ